MSTPVPIKAIAGVELVPTQLNGISRVVVLDTASLEQLSWDRYVRLNAVAKAIRESVDSAATILDVGGFDGALGLFLPDYNIDLLDPATTGGSILTPSATSQSYNLVASIDVLEHIAPEQRKQALKQLTRIASSFVVLNYPHPATKLAQQLIFHLTKNALIKEHAEWQLPESTEISEFMQTLGFNCEARSHSSLAVWLGQYLCLDKAPEAASELSKYLIKNHADEPFSSPLYELLLCRKVD